jgi:hypothetical protein
MYVGYEQFPPPVLLVRLPTSYEKSMEVIGCEGSQYITFCVNGALDMDLSQDIGLQEYTATVYPTSSNGPS